MVYIRVRSQSQTVLKGYKSSLKKGNIELPEIHNKKVAKQFENVNFLKIKDITCSDKEFNVGKYATEYTKKFSRGTAENEFNDFSIDNSDKKIEIDQNPTINNFAIEDPPKYNPDDNKIQEV
eukprot:CAMPEP_0170530138 /NCGR_PEP_ID=MMETSP0209-20121228/41835_1 /TAXON_ID=665100 ORGANISM="Litonotus pictus, Strain P1" /NCGR_SAMPLE_ID=MMETSP0209 /ASSEMBLY_ACC=CAM_ASM_000301 /LENGTH=121 /DNA_ID=CAMNT_0010822927 /DNA_START=189 /DNA_END=550 /DNA_ORIENTATION=+